MNIKVVKITVINESGGGDQIVLELNLPEGLWPFADNANAKIVVAKGAGYDYATKHFVGVPIELIKVKNKL